MITAEHGGFRRESRGHSGSRAEFSSDWDNSKADTTVNVYMQSIEGKREAEARGDLLRTDGTAEIRGRYQESEKFGTLW
jgi:hypothetical protein